MELNASIKAGKEDSVTKEEANLMVELSEGTSNGMEQLEAPNEISEKEDLPKGVKDTKDITLASNMSIQEKAKDIAKNKSSSRNAMFILNLYSRVQPLRKSRIQRQTPTTSTGLPSSRERLKSEPFIHMPWVLFSNTYTNSQFFLVKKPTKHPRVPSLS
ncbi:hypothetical protein VNO78_21174 [Psophocarpus tetragonolobus]|uniref:Uncharacterized protein n=1 Tax=Psophocarpus tetragonolobus TaxID=3891 RepID=A0AAN9SAM0_PSOTE